MRSINTPKARKVSILVSDTKAYMARNRGRISISVVFSQETTPLASRIFGDEAPNRELSDADLDEKFGGINLLTLLTAAIAAQYIFPNDSCVSLYTDKAFSGYMQSCGLHECEIWDIVDDQILSTKVTNENHDARWAYSAGKPFAMLIDADLVRRTRAYTGSADPILFHDTDLILHRGVDRMLGIHRPDQIKMGFSHLESIGTEFYPPISTLKLPAAVKLLPDGRLLHKASGRIYRTDLKAVNTCLMYFQDLDICEEWAELFRDLIMNIWLDEPDWLLGEQHLLAFDQRPGLMVADRLGLKPHEDIRPMLPLEWNGNTFLDMKTGKPAVREWHYFHPGYRPGEANRTQDFQHLWIQKADIMHHIAYENYLSLYDLELMSVLCPEVGIDWINLEYSLRRIPSLQRYFALRDTGLTLDEHLLANKQRPVHERLVDDVLLKGLSEPLIPAM